MPFEIDNNWTMTGGTLYIDDQEIAEFTGIPELELDLDAYEDYVKDECRKNVVMCVDPQGEFKAIFKLKWNPFMFYRLTGLYDYVITYCPNKRVVHLIKHGKNFRVKHKNFKRAVHIVGMLLERIERGKI